MGKISKMVLIAGAALSVASPVLAQNADQTRAYAAELKSDAAGRSSLQGSGGAQGLTITDGTGNFSLRVGALLQFRYTANFRSDGTNVDIPAPNFISSDDDFTHGFSRPRTTLRFSGNAGAPELSYYIQGNFDENQASFNLEDAYAAWTWDNGFSAIFGQWKVPVVKEWAMDEGRMLSASRSIVGTYFGQGITGRTQGILGAYKTDSFRLGVSFNDGANTANTQYNNAAEADWALTGRADVKLAGDWSQADEFSSFRNRDFAAFIGGGIHWQESGSTGDGNDAAPAPGVNAASPSTLVYTLDAQVAGSGWGAYAAFIGRNSDLDVAGQDDIDDYGIMLQGSVFLADQWELFGRWDWLMFDKNNNNFVVAPDELDPDDLHYLTLGVNYFVFPESQVAKLTLDVVIGLNESYEIFRGPASGNFTGNGAVAAGNAGPDLGVLGDIDSGEFAIRGQFQLMF